MTLHANGTPPRIRTAADHMRQLRRRVAVLDGLVADPANPKNKKSSWRGERAALRWAIEQLGKPR